MKTRFILASILLALCGLASAAEKQKTFNLVVDPPDASVKILSGNELREQRYHTPATITVVLPQDPGLARRAVVEITRDDYKPAVMALQSIRDGERLKIKLEKIVRDRIKFSLLGPDPSEDLAIRDDTLSMDLTVDEKQFHVTIANRSAQTISVVWQRAQYIDTDGRPHRLLPAGIPLEERNLPFRVQTMLPGITLHQALTPVDSISFSRGTGTFQTQPLFAMHDAGDLTGKVFDLLIPVDIGGKIVSYGFKVKIAGVERK